jgi:hypothetical protein
VKGWGRNTGERREEDKGNSKRERGMTIGRKNEMNVKEKREEENNGTKGIHKRK